MLVLWLWGGGWDVNVGAVPLQRPERARVAAAEEEEQEAVEQRERQPEEQEEEEAGPADDEGVGAPLFWRTYIPDWVEHGCSVRSRVGLSTDNRYEFD